MRCTLLHDIRRVRHNIPQVVQTPALPNRPLNPVRPLLQRLTLSCCCCCLWCSLMAVCPASLEAMRLHCCKHAPELNLQHTTC
jgi:hypothetical protein